MSHIDPIVSEDGDKRTPVIMSHNKGLVFGHVLVDDYPFYINKWVSQRPRGLVLMPKSPINIDDPINDHPNVLPFDERNLDQVELALEAVKNRDAGAPLIW